MLEPNDRPFLHGRHDIDIGMGMAQLCHGTRLVHARHGIRHSKRQSRGNLCTIICCCIAAFMRARSGLVGDLSRLGGCAGARLPALTLVTMGGGLTIWGDGV
jgi:hypothetical protein